MRKLKGRLEPIEDLRRDVEEDIEITPFVTEPAKIIFHKGKTINTGDFQSERIDISIEMPCYVEEILQVYEEVALTVKYLLNVEEDRILDNAISDEDLED